MTSVSVLLLSHFTRTGESVFGAYYPSKQLQSLRFLESNLYFYFSSRPSKL